jgi:hypothetical protein
MEDVEYTIKAFSDIKEKLENDMYPSDRVGQ